jgi:hypothetical protein
VRRERVGRRARGEQLADTPQAVARGVAVGEQRSRPGVAHAAQDLLGRGRETDDRSRGREPPPVVRVEQRTAAGGDHRLGHQAGLGDRRALELAEARLALAGEDVGHGLAGGRLDQAVGVHEGAAETARQAAADLRLPGGHEAGQDHLRHP